MLIKKLFLNNGQKKFLFPVLMIVFLVIIFPGYSFSAQTDVREAIVKVYTVSNYPDYYNPWSMQGHEQAPVQDVLLRII